MAFFPRIDSPCPYKDRLASVMKGDFCTMCKRDVFELSHMNDLERVAFLKSCSGEVCVKYNAPVRAIAAAAALVAATMPMALAAQDAAHSGEAVAMEEDYGEIIVGGILDPKKTAAHEDKADATTMATLPVVYEENDTDRSTPEQGEPAK
jgi:predicted Fe-S protein YdhL (DUF1289 family)